MGKAELPFGKPFKYTETLDFASDTRSWWQFWKPSKKPPEAWIVNEGADEVGSAYICPPLEAKISAFEPDSVTAIYNKSFAEDLVIFNEERKDLDSA